MFRYILVVMLIIVLGGCGVNDQTAEPVESELIVETDEDLNVADKAEYRKITPEEAKEMMVEGNIILDVRTQAEYEQGHIQEAMLLPVDSILDGDLESLPDKNQTILVYCRSGNRSATASKALVEAGYMNVYDFGGISDWPYDVVQ
jgi:rhodanese-related sulfurtransferase